MRSLFLFLILLFIPFLSFSQEIKTTIIYFEMDEDTISVKNQSIIDTIIKINDVLKIEITAFTDFISTKEYNRNLSKRRSKSVYNYLIKKGISKRNITKCLGLGIYPNSNFNQRKDTTDQGIADHRIAIITCQILIPKEELKIDSSNLLLKTIEELKIGDQLVLENIFFYGGTPIFKPESDKTLNDLLKIMQQYPTLEIEIQGHICCKFDGSDGYDMVNHNEFLSVNRAKAVYDYLVSKGINAKRMIYKGFGSSVKRYPEEKTPEEEDMNRRVEIKILNK
jgi:outer membrane protein OmpA-like peptidoglycan-associated protein